MTLDLKIISSDANGLLNPNTWPNPDFVEGLYSLVSRIYKNLLTVPGTDAFDPGWGSDLRGALTRAMISVGPEDQAANQLGKAVVQAVAQKCRLDLATEPAASPDQQLSSLGVNDVVYDVTQTAWNVSFTVVSAAGDSATTSFNV